jgi:hypothetical protein
MILIGLLYMNEVNTKHEICKRNISVSICEPYQLLIYYNIVHPNLFCKMICMRRAIAPMCLIKIEIKQWMKIIFTRKSQRDCNKRARNMEQIDSSPFHLDFFKGRCGHH